MKGDVVMSFKAINRAEVMEKLVRKEVSQKQAATTLKITVRQVKRLVRRFKQLGVVGLTHQAKGRPSNNRIDQKKLDTAMEIIKDKYWDFGPTLASEKLWENHQIKIGVERLRQEMISIGLWQPKPRRQAQIHQLRERRACFGELHQLDGSPHDWFEGRGDCCNLNVDIDDATGIPILEFSPTETTQGYFSLVEKHLTTYGIPIAFYADRHSIFQVSRKSNVAHKKPSIHEEEEGLTQFGRAMKELGITLIPANSPQAKGRVERINATLQNRLVKELRLRNISSIEEANVYLPQFTADYVTKFAVTPRSMVDMHRRLPENIDLTQILCLKVKRVLSKNLTCQFQGIIYQIQSRRAAYGLRHMSVTLFKRYDGTVTIRDNRDKLLEYTTIKLATTTQETNSKEINRLVDDLLVKQLSGLTEKRNPWESSQQELDEMNYCYKSKKLV
jgi:transposase